MQIEITIPVLNEEKTLKQQVEATLVFIRESLSDIEGITLVIADNGSTDQTAAIALALANNNENIKFIHVPRPGVGLALSTSWLQSEADIVGYMDLDLATDLRHLRQALEPLLNDSEDVVTGSRLLPQSKVIGRPLKREIVSRAFNYILRWYMGVGFSDGMCGFKFLQRKHLLSILMKGAVSEGWFFSTEVLICAQNLGLRLLDLPICWTDDSRSKVRIGKLGIEYIFAMRRLKARDKVAGSQ